MNISLSIIYYRAINKNIMESSQQLQSVQASPTQKQCENSQQFILDYQCHVLHKNSLFVTIGSICTFILYLLVEAFSYNARSASLSMYERGYIAETGVGIADTLTTQLRHIKGIAGMYKEMLYLNYGGNNLTDLLNVVQPLPIIPIALPPFSLIQPIISQISPTPQLFLNIPSSSPSVISYNLSSSSNILAPILSPLITNYFSQFNNQSYLASNQDSDEFVLIIKVYKQQTQGSEDDYQFKILHCETIENIGNGSAICLLTGGNIQDTLQRWAGQSQNKVSVLYERMLAVKNGGIQWEHRNYLQFISQQLKKSINQSVSDEDRQFFMSFPFDQCIAQYQVSQYLQQSNIRVCNPPEILYFFAPISIFLNLKIPLSSSPSSPSLNILLFSNSTFHRTESSLLKTLSLKHSNIFISMIILHIIWLLFLPVPSLNYLSTQLAPLIPLLIRLSQAVRICTRDELDSQLDQFNKLYLELSKKSNLFNSILEYFKYFIWYRKWLYTSNKIGKRKLLIEEGLTLFGSSEYAPVLIYIYKKQIQRQKKLLGGYKRMRKIFMQNFVIFQNQQKIQGSINGFKQRVAARKFKKSGFNTEREQQDAFGQDFCMIENVENRINKQLEFLQIQKKSKRYVRFSNDLHQQQKPFQYRASKFLLNIPSQSSIVKNSQKSIDDQLPKKKSPTPSQPQPQSQSQSCPQPPQRQRQGPQQQIGSNPVESSRQQRFAQQFRDQDKDSEYSQKNYFNQNQNDWNLFLKFDQTQQSNSLDDEEDQSLQLKKYSFKKLDEKLGETYQGIFRAYQKMIVIKKMYIDKQEVTEVYEYINELYWMLIEKLRYTYKFVKHKNDQRQKMLKQLSRKLINIKKQKRGLKQLDIYRREKIMGSQKWLQQTISVIQDEILEESKLIDIEFKQFTSLEQRYKIQQNLIQKASLYQIKILRALNYPIPYKKLQNLCDSSQQQLRIESKIIMGGEFFHMSPHADLQILSKVQQNLSQNHTTYTQKKKALKLIKRVLKNRQIMEQEEEEVELIANFYNYMHKKFYFVVDLSDNYQVFRPTLMEIYRNMGQTDMFQILNLAMNEIMQDMIASRNQIKPTKFSDFQIKFQSIHNEANKIKSIASTKTGNKKMAFEKDFNRILTKIQQQDINLSKFLVLILGGENESQSRTHQDHQSSSAQNRQAFQIIHQQILTKMQKNYFHLILIGFNLKDYQTRQGKLKKYVKHSHDYIEVDLGKGNTEQIFKQLGKFLKK